MDSKQIQPEAFHINASYCIGYDQDMFQRFCKLKDETTSKQDLYVNAKTNESQKLILHMGEGPSLVKVARDKALFVGGVAVLPNRHVLLFDQNPQVKSER
jgi:hypothetical protein